MYEHVFCIWKRVSDDYLVNNLSDSAVYLHMKLPSIRLQIGDSKRVTNYIQNMCDTNLHEYAILYNILFVYKVCIYTHIKVCISSHIYNNIFITINILCKKYSNVYMLKKHYA